MCEIGVHIRTRGQQRDVERAASKIEEILPDVERRLGGRKAALAWLADQLGVSAMWVRRIRGRFGAAVVWAWQIEALDQLLEAEAERQIARFKLNQARIAAHLRNEKKDDETGEGAQAPKPGSARRDGGRDRHSLDCEPSDRGSRAAA